MNRSEMAYREMTRDPVFLLQRKEHIVIDERYHEHGLQNDGKGPTWPNGRPCSIRTLERLGVLVPYWSTAEGVFWSREEAEQFALTRKYDWGKQGEDWRVYCTTAEGKLARVLDASEDSKPVRREPEVALAAIKSDAIAAGEPF